MNFELIAPCHFGLEAVLKRELTDLNYDILCTEDGRVTFAVLLARRILQLPLPIAVVTPET